MKYQVTFLSVENNEICCVTFDHKVKNRGENIKKILKEGMFFEFNNKHTYVHPKSILSISEID